MRIRSISLTICASVLFLSGAAHAVDVPVVIDPLHSDEGYMFDWIFFAIMIPIPAFLLWDNRRNR